MKKTLKGIEQSHYKLNHNSPFRILARNVKRPYFPISEKVYDDLCNQEKFKNDVVLFKGELCTFGGADSGYALMPIINKELLIDTRLL